MRRCFLAFAGRKAGIAFAFELSGLRIVGANLVIALLRGDQFAGAVEPAAVTILHPVDAADNRCQQQQAGSHKQRNPDRRIFFAVIIIFSGLQPWQPLFLVQIKTVACGI